MSPEKNKINDESFVHFVADELNVQQTAGLMVGGIAPRPIAFVSTISADGTANLAPFSYFNAFGSTPPVVAFSPARKGRDAKLKDTYHNLLDNGECVVQVVTFPIVEQMSVSSAEYPPNVDEFIKSGLTKIPSHIVKPPRVLESPFQMECKLIQLIHFGGKGGSGIMAVCEVLKFHVNKNVMTDEKIDPLKMDHVGRNGGAYYTHAMSTSMFEIRQPATHLGVGYDQLPEAFKSSHDLSANDLGQLASIEKIPTLEESVLFAKESGVKKDQLIKSAKDFLKQRKTMEAWKTLVIFFNQ